MVICGAGASHDSIPHVREDLPHTSRMPLGDDLFAARDDFREISKSLTHLLPLISKLAKPADGGSVESLLGQFEAEVSHLPHRRGQLLAARFYLREAIFTAQSKWQPVSKNVTNYVTLLEDLRSYAGSTTPHLLVTFNYDTLLEHAIEMMTNRRPFEMASYQAADCPFPLYKLHGSVGWGHPISIEGGLPSDLDGTGLVNILCSKAGSLVISEAFEPLPFQPPHIRSSEGVFVPAIALPVSSKNKFECPDAHVSDLRSKLPGVDRIVSIGWKAGEETFLELLSEALPDHGRWLTVGIDRAEGRELARRIAQRIPNWDFIPASGKFSNLVTGDELKRFLLGQDPSDARTSP